MNCKRCGLPFKITDTEYSHVTCDEFEQEETWLTPEELKEKEERIRAYQRKKNENI